MKTYTSKLIRILQKKKLKIAFAESCTGGMLSNLITSISGASKVFNMGMVVYSNQSKINLLKVPKSTIIKYGAVSEECCKAMVKNLSKIAKSNISLATTGIAGPKGGLKKKPVRLVYIGFKKGNKIKVNKYIFPNKGRLFIQKASVKKSLELILASFK